MWIYSLLISAFAMPDFQAGQIQPTLKTFEVVGTQPTANALHQITTTSISVEFTQPLDTTSVTQSSFQVLGRWSAMRSGTFSFSANSRTATFTPTDPFSAGETVFVMLSTDIRNQSGTAMSRGYAWSFWIASRAGTMNFLNIATFNPGSTPYGGYGGDLDADGDLDLAICNENSRDVAVFLNQNNTSLSGPVSYPAGYRCSPSEAADFDADGRLDLAVANISDNDVSILLGNGDGTFQPQVRYPVGWEPRGLTMLDAEGDGDMDLITANRVRGDMSLLINLGDGTFAPEISFEGFVGGETGTLACDMNNDGIPDLVVVGHSSNQVSVLLGDGTGNFQLHHRRTVGDSPWMVTCADVNGDGFNDVGAALSDQGEAAVLLNDGTGNLLAPNLYDTGSFPIAFDFGDLNGDGHLDFASSAFFGGYDLYTNQGDGTFGNRLFLPAIFSGSCTILHDIDSDGDLDISAVDEVVDRLFIFNQSG